MRYLMVISALVLVLGVSLSAQAGVQNVKVGGDIQVRGISRGDFDLNDQKTTAGDDEAWYDSIVRLQIEAELTDDVGAVIRFINEKDWDATLQANEDIELDISYITLDSMFGYPAKATIGRQEILFGEGFLIGDGFLAAGHLAADGSSRSAFDALRVTYSAEPYTVDLFTAKINDDTTTNADVNDVDLHGLNINYDYLGMATFDIGYFVKKDGGTTNNDGETRAISLRGEGEIAAVPGLTVKAEYVTEDGDIVDTTGELDADAWYLGAEYAFQDNIYAPYLGLTYTVMSGDDGSGAPDSESFDPLYEDVGFGEIVDNFADDVGGAINTNLEALKIAAGLRPTDALSVDLAYYILSRAEVAAGVDDELGNELDLTLTYDYTEDVQFGLTAAWFEPGDYYKNTYGTNYEDKATQIMGSVKVSF